MRRVLIASLALLLAGCAGNEEKIWELEAQLDVKDVEIKELKDELAQKTAGHKRTINILQDSIERTEMELRSVRETLTAQLEARDAAIEKLNKQVEDLTIVEETNAATSAESTAIQEPDTTNDSNVRISTVATPPQPRNFPPPPPPADEMMPVQAYQIVGRKLSTGSHRTRRYVETNETYRDQFGNTKKRGEWVEDTVDEYGYKVSFSLRNLSDEDLTITARAGLVDKAILLRPGEVRENIVIDAANGSSLILLSGGHRKRFEVSY